jgi:hypothetical protein
MWNSHDSQEDLSGFIDEDVLELHISNNEGEEYYIEPTNTT